MDKREKLLKTIQGEYFDPRRRYYIEYSLDIRGNIIIWGGDDFPVEEMIPIFDDPQVIVNRRLVPVYDYNRLSPYTARIYQMEQEIDETIPDEVIIEEYVKFRKSHPEDGFGYRALFMRSILDRTESSPKVNRDDKEEIMRGALERERQDILKMWGVDCPPDVNNSKNYGERLNQNRGQVSEWFQNEFARIGGDWGKLWSRK